MQLKDTPAIILVFIIVAITASISANILEGMNTALQSDASYSVVNETVTVSLVTNVSLQHSRIVNSSFQLDNESWEVVVANYSLNPTEGTIVFNNSNSAVASGVLLNASYSYLWNTNYQSENISKLGLAAIMTIGSWQNILAIVCISAIVIGIVVLFLGAGGGGRRGA